MSRHTGHKKDDGMTQEERWITRYQELRNFMEKEHRNPSKYDDTERGLYYNWLRHNVKLYNNGEMKVERVERFEELLGMCERYRRKNQWE